MTGYRLTLKTKNMLFPLHMAIERFKGITYRSELTESWWMVSNPQQVFTKKKRKTVFHPKGSQNTWISQLTKMQCQI